MTLPLAKLGSIRETNGDREWVAQELLSRHRSSANKRGIGFSLTKRQILRMIEASEGRCQVTGVPFEYGPARGKRRPFFPSIDRIDSGKNYHHGNVRLVCVAANIAMNEWGDYVIQRMLQGHQIPLSLEDADAEMTATKELQNLQASVKSRNACVMEAIQLLRKDTPNVYEALKLLRRTLQ